jgi:hypothetical protein
VDPLPELRWRPLPHVVSGYVVTVTRAEDAAHPWWGTPPFGGLTFGASLTLSPPLPPGNYTWTVTRYVRPGDPLGAGPLSTGHFVVPGDTSISLLSPAPGETVPSNGAILRWAPVEGADSYWVILATDPSMQVAARITDGWTDTTEFAVPVGLPTGPVYWIVCAETVGYPSGLACSPPPSTSPSSASEMPTMPSTRMDGTPSVLDGGVPGPIGMSEVRMMMVEGREVAPDSVPPTVTSPDLVAIAGAQMTTSGTVPLKVTWAAADRGVGLSSVSVVLTDASGRTVTHPAGLTATTLAVRLKAGTYGVAVVATDLAGNRTMRSVSRRLTIVDNPSSSWKWSASWRKLRASSAYRGSVHASSTSGARSSVAVKARSVALVVSRGPTRGTVVASTAGMPSRTVKLRTTAAKSRVVMPLWAWRTSATRTIRFRLPSGGRRVVIDALIVIQ